MKLFIVLRLMGSAGAYNGGMLACGALAHCFQLCNSVTKRAPTMTNQPRANQSFLADLPVTSPAHAASAGLQLSGALRTAPWLSRVTFGLAAGSHLAIPTGSGSGRTTAVLPAGARLYSTASLAISTKSTPKNKSRAPHLEWALHVRPYTPAALVDFACSKWLTPIVDHLMQAGKDAFLVEPACGNGAFADCLWQIAEEFNSKESAAAAIESWKQAAVEVQAYEMFKDAPVPMSLVDHPPVVWDSLGGDALHRKSYTGGKEDTALIMVGNPPWGRRGRTVDLGTKFLLVAHHAQADEIIFVLPLNCLMVDVNAKALFGRKAAGAVGFKTQGVLKELKPGGSSFNDTYELVSVIGASNVVYKENPTGSRFPMVLFHARRRAPGQPGKEASFLQQLLRHPIQLHELVPRGNKGSEPVWQPTRLRVQMQRVEEMSLWRHRRSLLVKPTPSSSSSSGSSSSSCDEDQQGEAGTGDESVLASDSNCTAVPASGSNDSLSSSLSSSSSSSSPYGLYWSIEWGARNGAPTINCLSRRAIQGEPSERNGKLLTLPIMTLEQLQDVAYCKAISSCWDKLARTGCDGAFQLQAVPFTALKPGQLRLVQDFLDSSAPLADDLDVNSQLLQDVATMFLMVAKDYEQQGATKKGSKAVDNPALVPMSLGGTEQAVPADLEARLLENLQEAMELVHSSSSSQDWSILGIQPGGVLGEHPELCSKVPGLYQAFLDYWMMPGGDNHAVHAVREAARDQFQRWLCSYFRELVARVTVLPQPRLGSSSSSSKE